MPHPDFYYEKSISNQGAKYIVGIDEVGRGTLAGPVVVGSIIFDINNKTEQYLIDIGINDSKKLSEKKRLYLYEILIKIAISYSTGWASVEEIDKLGINQSIELAMKRSLGYLITDPDHLLIDAITLKDSKYEQTNIIKGDQKSLSIASGSIIAKVERDNYMINLNKNNEIYDLKNNKGYGTKKHIEAIKLHGKTNHHRKSFKIKGVDYINE
jgi:ribonuclease HII